MTTDITAADQDRDIIDLNKEYITQDKKRGVVYTSLLKDYISFLKGEIIYKNKWLRNYSNISYKDTIIETRLSNISYRDTIIETRLSNSKGFSNKGVLN